MLTGARGGEGTAQDVHRAVTSPPSALHLTGGETAVHVGEGTVAARDVTPEDRQSQPGDVETVLRLRGHRPSPLGGRFRRRYDADRTSGGSAPCIGRDRLQP
ncbi:hypothetical protein GCM10009625_03180 [Brachybacterium fresconis]